ncbi:hypothetical protein KIH39_04490 [Telmatocola sphagniphila]|uniref:Carboxypeptidase regulatory-like domain-containing protein n=1 Tax=Telmatocola sphagniphila TaxID=1123043 RepID=A0A8E6B895_9BACT|nr:hypothetical protein [Telmatocola sphagniphila]QVL33182.1 hypothetical protein KIH39_04490 [Telmatocola sphagniphila]
MKYFWVAILSFACISCSGDPYNGHPPQPVSGQVLINGEPAKGASIIFHHEGDWGTRSIVPQATCDQEGKFVMSTYSQNDGAPEGEYKIALSWPAYRTKKASPDKLNGKFSDPKTSGLKVTIHPGKNELAPIEIKARVLDIKLDTKHK